MSHHLWSNQSYVELQKEESKNEKAKEKVAAATAAKRK
jgi:hypothetical protein